MRTSFALVASILAGAPLFGAPLAQSQLYSKPTYAQVMRLIETVKGNTSEHGPWNDGSVPASRLYSSPTYSQVDTLTKAVKEYVGRSTNAYTKSETDAKIADSISEDNPAFSNAVLAVQIDTNTVAQIGELKQFFDDLPTGTVGTSLGGIILALLGATAWLKKNKADKSNTYTRDETDAAIRAVASLGQMTNLGDGRYEYTGALTDASTQTYPREGA